jgi:FKBP-type peptidyl-prolyl cis-trans isomerase SlyD
MIEKGSKVSIHYTLTVDGEKVDSSEGMDPLAFVQGAGQIIPGLDEEMIGLKVGDKKSLVIATDKAYGPRNPEAVQKVPLEAFKEADKLKAGDVVSGSIQDRPFQAVVMENNGKEVTLDLNHPLAGKTLNFDVEVVSVEAA